MLFPAKQWFLVLSLAVSGPLAASAATYTTGPVSGWIYPFGVGESSSVSTVGQTFVAPENTLESWTFYLGYSSGTSPLDFTIRIMPWDTASGNATGSLLYQSPVFTIDPTADVSFLPYTITPHVSLNIGANYVIFANQTGLNPSEYTNGALGTAFVTTSTPTPALGGHLVYGGDLDNLTSPLYWGKLPSMQAAYTATFSNQTAPIVGVPDSGPLLPAVLGSLALLAAVGRRVAKDSRREAGARS